MPKSVTVEFEDGTSHTYDNVPDNIDDETVRDRAANEYKDKSVMAISAGKPAEDQGPSTTTKLIGGAQTAFDVLKPIGEFAMEHPIATGVGVSLLPEAITSKIPVINQAAQYGRGVLQRVSGITPVSNAAQKTFSSLAGGEAQPGIIQRGMDVAKQLGRGGMNAVTNVASKVPGIEGAAGAIPAAAFSMPYAGAAYEQAQIRANPNAPQYANNPYAMQQRGVAPTQGAAGAMNTRNAIANQQYGGLTQLEKDALEQDRLDRAIRLKAAKKVLGQQ